MICEDIRDAGTLEASDDGENFRRRRADLPRADRRSTRFRFAPVTAKYFRVTFQRASAAAPTWRRRRAQCVRRADYAIAELVLHPGARVNHFEEKAAFTSGAGSLRFATPELTTCGCDPEKRCDRSDRQDASGRNAGLDAAAGQTGWCCASAIRCWGSPIIRRPQEATGLEVDKLNAPVREELHGQVSRQLQGDGRARSMMGKRGIRYVVNDSWEAGSQNWTDNMIAQFTRLRGYDPHAVAAGAGGPRGGERAGQRPVSVGLPQDDCRPDRGRALRPAGSIAEERGMGHYGESHESGRAFIADGMEVKKSTKFP